MKKMLYLAIATLPVTMFCVGCGGAPETDPAAVEEAKALETDATYEKEMMGEMSGAAKK